MPPIYPIPLPPIVAVVLIAYFAYATWNAYSTGVNHGMLKNNKIKGIITIGPYLSLLISFAGIAIVIFILYELFGYYDGFVRANLPTDLSQLDFSTFILRQFTLSRPDSGAYYIFLGFGLILSSISSFLVVHILYLKGVQKSGYKPK